MPQPDQRRPILSTAADALLFVFSPHLALVFGLVLIYLARNDEAGPAAFTATVLSAVFVHAHLILVFARTHLNKAVFKRFPLRFTVVPAAALLVQLLSPLATEIVFIVVVWWDVFHSSQQTYGIGRIFDRLDGVKEISHPRLERLWNLAIYALPIFFGASMHEHMSHFSNLGRFGFETFAAIPHYGLLHAEEIKIIAVVLTVVLSVVWLRTFSGFSRKPFGLSRKGVLYLTTATTSLIAWSALPPVYAFFVMNFFHALQYFAIVWWSERGNLSSLLRLPVKPGLAGAVMGLIIAGLCFAYGASTQIFKQPEWILMALVNVVSLMHFWYDGFVWRVSKIPDGTLPGKAFSPHTN